METNNHNDLGLLVSGIINNPKLKRKLVRCSSNLMFRKTKFIYARHFNPEDLLFNIISKLLDGKINWKREKSSLYNFLLLRIKSEVANLVKKESQHPHISLHYFEERTKQNIEDDEMVEGTLRELIVDPFQDLFRDESEDLSDSKLLIDKVFEMRLDELRVFNEMFKGHQPRQIAALLHISGNEVYNIKKRIKRVLGSVQLSHYQYS